MSRQDPWRPSESRPPKSSDHCAPESRLAPPMRARTAPRGPCAFVSLSRGRPGPRGSHRGGRRPSCWRRGSYRLPRGNARPAALHVGESDAGLAAVAQMPLSQRSASARPTSPMTLRIPKVPRPSNRGGRLRGGPRRGVAHCVWWQFARIIDVHCTSNFTGSVPLHREDVVVGDGNLGSTVGQ